MFGEVSNDNRILAVALNYQIEENEKEVVERQVVLVSKDVLVRIKADVLGLFTQDYLSDRTAGLSELYLGYTALKVHPSVIDEFYTYRFYQSNRYSCLTRYIRMNSSFSRMRWEPINRLYLK